MKQDLLTADQIAVLLDRLAYQQTALLRAYEETGRVQRLVLERLLGGEAGGGTGNTDLAPTPAAAPAPDHTPVIESAPAAAAPPPPPVPPSPVLPVRPVPRVVPVPRIRPRRAAGDGTPPSELDLLRRLASSGEAGDYLLRFGPYQGSSLRQVALKDPAYLRTLAERAQRPEVRAAALAVVRQLEPPRPPRPPRAGRAGRPSRRPLSAPGRKTA